MTIPDNTREILIKLHNQAAKEALDSIAMSEDTRRLIEHAFDVHCVAMLGLSENCDVRLRRTIHWEPKEISK